MDKAKPPPAGVDATVWAQLPRSLQEEYLADAARAAQPPKRSQDPPSIAHAPKRPKLNVIGASEWTLSGVDAGAPAAAKVEEAAREDTFVDREFPPELSSLSGSQKDLSKAERKVVCKCGIGARQRTVSKDNANQNRRFWGCAKYPNGCNFFQWARKEDWDHGRSFTKFFWRRPLAHFGQPKVIRGTRPNFRGSDIMQGKVGDCWFIAALFVVAEREDLISRLVETRSYCTQGGPYLLWLFIDCEWRQIIVDDWLPHYADKKGNAVLAFSKARDQCLWLPLLEKAYAKAHGSYRAISGGWIDEAMFDLTSYPTQTIHLSGIGFDKDTTWQKLLSYSASEFPMGCSCMNPGKGSGLVGHHAYSIIEVKECANAVLGSQGKLDAYFQPKGKQQHVEDKPTRQASKAMVEFMTEEQQIEHAIRMSLAQKTGSSSEAATAPAGSTNGKTLRMLRIRNPWGRGEWKGAFSGKSEMWTAKLRKVLKNVTSSNDGTFWIEYDDFLAHYAHGTIDVCMAHPNWHSSNVNLRVPQSSWVANGFVEVKAMVNTWTYISIAQPTKRGKADGRYYYSPISFLLVRKTSGNASAVKVVKLAGKCKVYHSDVILDRCSDDESYLIIPFIAVGSGATTRKHDASFTVRLFSAEPLQTRSVRPDSLLTLRLIHWAVGLSSSSSLTNSGMSTSRIPLSQPGSYLIIVESRTCCMVVAVNGSSSRYLHCSFLLHGPGVGASNSVVSKGAKPLKDGGGAVEYPTYIIPPATQRVIEVISANVHSDEETELNQTGLFVLSQLQHFETHIVETYRQHVGTIREEVRIAQESSLSASSSNTIVDLT